MILRFLPFVWKNTWRNKRRSILTLLGVAVAVFVYAALNSAIVGMEFPLREVGDARLLNIREDGRANVLASRIPESYVQRVADVPGVRAATGVLDELSVVEGGVHVFVRGIVPDEYLAIQPLRVEPAGAWAELDEDPHAALVGFRLLAQLGWEVGSEVEVGELGLGVRVAGIIPLQDADLGGYMLVRRSFVQASRAAEGQVSYVVAAPEEGVSGDALSAAIDSTFEFAPVPTETSSAAGYAEAIVRDFLGILDYMRVVAMLAVLVVVLAAANAMAMSVRERTREIGTLKAIGFPPGLVRTIVLGEAALLSVLGGTLGLGGAWALVGNIGEMTGLMLEPSTIAISAGLTVLIGLVGGLVPAMSASRLNTIDAMRTVG